MLQVQVTALAVEFIGMHVPASGLTKTSKMRTLNHASLPLELDAPHAAGRRQEGVPREFGERVFNSYSVLICMHATSYCSPRNAVLADIQFKAEKVREYCRGVGEEWYIVRIDELSSEKEPDDRLSHRKDGDKEYIGHVFPPFNPPSSAS